MNTLQHNRAPHGTSLIEVLVTMVIVAIGLLGVAGLQSRMQISEVEAYQRSQALILLKDITSRLETNRLAAASYVTGADDPLGVGITCPITDGGSTRQEIDAAQWCHILQGAAEVSGSNSVGAMVGARGCIEGLPNNEYLITIAWQGQAPIAAPPASVACGKDLYNGATGSPCINDLCRRAVTTIVRIAAL